MNIVVTGGLGLQGSHLAQRLTGQGHLVTIIDNKSRGIATPVSEEITNMDLRYEKPDFKGTDIVFHLAARVTGVVRENEESILKDNIRIDLNVIDSCVKYNVPKLVYASSCAAEYEPHSGYGLAKLTTEQILAMHKDLPSVILRLFNVYGPGEAFLGHTHVIPELLRKFLWEDEVKVYGGGGQTRPFLYVDDAVDAYIAAMDVQGRLPVLDIAGRRQVSIAELVEMIKQVTGRNPKVSFDQSAKTGPRSVIPDLTEAREYLGWTPMTGIEEGIRRTCEWMKSVHTPPIQ